MCRCMYTVYYHIESLYSTHWVEQWAYVELLDIPLEQSCPGPFSQFCSVWAEIYSDEYNIIVMTLF